MNKTTDEQDLALGGNVAATNEQSKKRQLEQEKGG